jgi:hypothetical protein
MITHTNAPVSTVHDKVADLIEQRGLCKDNFVPDDAIDLTACPLCVLAAFNVAVGAPILGELVPDAYLAARAFADWLGIDPDADLTEALGDQWNDRPEQTQANVVRLLRRCGAEYARAGQ